MITCIECKKQPTVQMTSHPEYCHHTHYSISKLDGIDDLKLIFPDAKCDDMNWFVASTSGIHGTYTTLDEIEKAWEITDGESDGYVGRSLTVEVILPRMVRIIYGEVDIKSKEDIAFLRKLTQSSLKEIAKTQEGNM